MANLQALFTNPNTSVWAFLTLAIALAAFGGRWGFYAGGVICLVLAINISGINKGA